MSSENNNRIAKNTLMLYIRMSLTMFVSLYTSRIILDVLGVTDFGIYNVVAGVVGLFTFLNTAMAMGTQRFLSFEMGKRDADKVNEVFITSVNIHTGIALIILLLSETVGLWFLNNHLVIPEERLVAANWVYQFSIVTFLMTVLNVPYNATIIANEKMGFYAYISILEVILKLVAVLLLSQIPFDKLILYASLLFTIAVFVFIAYRIYCKKKFAECSYHMVWNRELSKSMLSYTGWNLFGTGAWVSYNQGINILLNIFFGPVVNAARGIAYQVNGAINGLVGNFQIALNPQITKSYASNDMKYLHQLIFQGSKYSFFLLFCVSLPILVETEKILEWWLKNVPEHAVIFCRLVLFHALIDSISFSMMGGIQATGKIKYFQIAIGILLLLILPISYFFLEAGYPPEVTLLVAITVSCVALMVRLLFARKLIQLPAKDFFSAVIARILLVGLLSPIVPILLKFYTEGTVLITLVVLLVSFCSVVLMVYVVGLRQNERDFLKIKCIEIIHKFRK